MNYVHGPLATETSFDGQTSRHAIRTPGDPVVATRILAEVTAYVPTLRARALETERLTHVPEETIRDLDAMGVYKMTVPVEYGGYASTPLQIHAVVAAIASGCGSTGWVTWVTLTAAQWVGLYDRRFQDELFSLDWVGPLTCGAGNCCVARRVDDGYMLKGSWPFSSGCRHVAFVHVGLICPEHGNEPMLAQIPHTDIVIRDDWKVMGMAGTGSNTVMIEDEVFVPDYRVRPVKELFANVGIEPAPEGVLFKLDIASLTASVHSGVTMGIARGALDLFYDKIQTRKITHLHYERQSEAPITHIQLGELHCKMTSIELMSRNNVAQATAFAETGGKTTELDKKRVQLESSYVMKVAAEMTETILRASGASSIREDNPFQRMFRESKVAAMHAHMMHETCLETFGRAAVGMHTETSFNKNSVFKADRKH